MTWTKQVAEELDYAERRLRRGWTKGAFGAWEKGTGKVCLVGAAMYAHNRWVRETKALDDVFGFDDEDAITLREKSPLIELLYAWFETVRPEDFDDPTEFNDAEETTREDLLLELKKFRADHEPPDLPRPGLSDIA